MTIKIDAIGDLGLDRIMSAIILDTNLFLILVAVAALLIMINSNFFHIPPLLASTLCFLQTSHLIIIWSYNLLVNNSSFIGIGLHTLSDYHIAVGILITCLLSSYDNQVI